MLDVAEELFGELGYRAASMDEIAARAGISKPMLYHYYGSKDGLFLACLRRARAGMREAILTGALSGAVGSQRLFAALVAWFRFVDTHRSLWKIIEESVLELPGVIAEIESIRDEHTGLLASLIAAEAPAGAPVDALEIEVIAAAISGAGERVTRWRNHNPGLSPERAARHLMQLLWLGLDRMGAGEAWEIT